MSTSRWIGIFAMFVVFSVALVPSLSAQKLRGIVGYNVEQISTRLEKAEKLVKQGDRKSAAAYVATAKSQWDALNKDYKGKFDAKHPAIVAVQKRFDALAAQLGAGGAGGDVKKPATGQAGADAGTESGSKAPPAAMAYVMKQVDRNLDGAEEAVKTQRLDVAKFSLQTAEKAWLAQKKWNVGKYDPQHPTVLALDAKYARVRRLVKDLAAESATAAASLPAVLTAIQDSQKRLNAAYAKARGSFRDVSSLMGDFDSGREQNIDKLRMKVEELRDCAERVNALLPTALAAAKALRQQYPDTGRLSKLVRNGRAASDAAKRLETFPKIWLADSKRLIEEALEYADENIKQFGLNKMKVLTSGDELHKKLAADDAERWVLDYSSYLLEVIPSILPELPKEAQATLPEFKAARIAFVKRATPHKARILQVAEAIAKTRKDVASAERRRLESARFPKTSHKAGAEEKVIRAAWKKAIPDKKLIRISIYRPYEVRAEARLRNKTWVVSTYRYLGVNCLARLRSGKFMVYRMTFRNTQQADGGWSALEHWGVGHVFEILEENAAK